MAWRYAQDGYEQMVEGTADVIKGIDLEARRGHYGQLIDGLAALIECIDDLDARDLEARMNCANS